MNFHTPNAELYIPDDAGESAALARTTHLAVGAHHDDLEIMAAHAIVECHEKSDRWFGGVTASDGRSSPRNGNFVETTDEEMAKIRAAEQKKAAALGCYSFVAMLAYSTNALKTQADSACVDDLERILKKASPNVVFTHNLFDKHDTHVAVALRVVAAIRRMPQSERPQHLFGLEVWRDLDWLHDDDKVLFDCSENEALQADLLKVFESQISGGKRYDLAALGRRRAHATYQESQRVDAMSGLVIGVDMTPLIEDAAVDMEAYVESKLDSFANDVRDRLRRLRG